MMEVSLVSLGLGSAQLAEEGTALLPVKAVPAALKAPTRMVGSLPTFAAYTGAVGPAEAHAVACLGRPRMSGSIDGDTMAHCIARRASAPHNPSPRPHTRKRHLPPWASSRPRSSSRAQHEAARQLGEHGSRPLRASRTSKACVGSLRSRPCACRWLGRSPGLGHLQRKRAPRPSIPSRPAAIDEAMTRGNLCIICPQFLVYRGSSSISMSEHHWRNFGVPARAPTAAKFGGDAAALARR